MTHPRDDIEPIQIGSRRIGPGHPPFVIAEIAANHQGDLGFAKRLVKLAAAMGADCAKFQLHIVEDEMLREVPKWGNLDEPLWDLLVRTHLTPEQHRELMRACEAEGIQYLCTPFSRAAADILEDLGVEAFKLGSGELTNIPLQRHIAKKGRPMIVSTGMSRREEVQATVDAVRDLKAPFALTHCVSAYPTPYPYVNLGMIQEYRDRYRVPVGLSDHSLGIYTALGAVALGADILEKHFTLDKWMHGPDHRVSLEPYELGEMCKGARAVFEAMGRERDVFDVESEVVAWARESVVTVAPLRKGEVISREHVWVKRPGPGKDGIPAKDLEDVIGRRARENVPTDRQLRWSDVEDA